MAGAVEARRKMSLGERHADRIGDTLAEWAGGGLHTRGFAPFRMAGGFGMQLPEGLQIIDGERIARQVQQRIEQHRAVAVGQHEAITIGPRWIGGVMHQEVAPQHLGDIGHAHGRARMAGIGGLHGIHAQSTNGVGQMAPR